MQWLSGAFGWIAQPRSVGYTPFDLVLIALATMYLAHAITSTHGPLNSFLILRDHTRHLLKGFFECVVCVAFWVALVLFLFYGIIPGLIWVLAIAGVALAIRTWSGIKHG